MKNFIICRGIPASGKSTWAKEYVLQNKDAVRINNDDMQMSLWNVQFRDSSKASRQLKDIRELLINYHMKEGVDIVLDNTNLPEAQVDAYKEMVTNHNLCTPKHMYKVVVKDFRDVPLSVCLKRNRMRDNPVPEEVIFRMYYGHVKGVISKPEQDKTLPKGIIIDIDGTIAEMGKRSPYDHTKYFEDTVIEDVLATVKASVAAGAYPIFLTGRDEAGRDITVKWLEEKAGFKKGTYTLLMRKVGDKRKAQVFKEESFIENVLGKYYIQAWYEDHVGNVEMARSKLGLTAVFQVGDGEY